MEYRRLGKTDISISRLGFGCWAIGGHGYGPINDNESIKTIKKAVVEGVNFFDTADVYGFGHSENILGKALQGSKYKVHVATKFGIKWDSRGRTSKDCNPKRMRSALEGSLRRLKLDQVALYQIHWHDGKTPVSDIMDKLLKFKKEGKIRYIGCSNFNYSLIRECFKTSRLESLQTSYNLLDKSMENFIANCRDNFEISILAYGVLSRGLLTGKFNEKPVFKPGDTRCKDRNFYGHRLRLYLETVGFLKKTGLRLNMLPSQIAIAWVLGNPFIDCAILGIKNRKQLLENSLPFKKRQTYKIRDYVESELIA